MYGALGGTFEHALGQRPNNIILLLLPFDIVLVFILPSLHSLSPRPAKKVFLSFSGVLKPKRD